ncbi:MAG: hypothetical protein A3I05_00750 [Deltaproteobacteria bacterium RIFCSPLOWO2_02_FULL_44_10]|nr:MAG: hypothetical protein A3C46_06630 [Deltaproteobacteria bacterium RIFCSPHIGHO2_02_FULL_44_16]OGQ46494.1 MAG: hypothetical protein A3I05_00750 [Deltaproteobacteria bacterium RIFCSPLOWO2_02_FULL_44_10]
MTFHALLPDKPFVYGTYYYRIGNHYGFWNNASNSINNKKCTSDGSGLYVKEIPQVDSTPDDPDKIQFRMDEVYGSFLFDVFFRKHYPNSMNIMRR